MAYKTKTDILTAHKLTETLRLYFVTVTGQVEIKDVEGVVFKPTGTLYHAGVSFKYTSQPNEQGEYEPDFIAINGAPTLAYVLQPLTNGIPPKTDHEWVNLCGDTLASALLSHARAKRTEAKQSMELFKSFNTSRPTMENSL